MIYSADVVMKVLIGSQKQAGTIGDTVHSEAANNSRQYRLLSYKSGS